MAQSLRGSFVHGAITFKGCLALGVACGCCIFVYRLMAALLRCRFLAAVPELRCELGLQGTGIVCRGSGVRRGGGAWPFRAVRINAWRLVCLFARRWQPTALLHGCSLDSFRHVLYRGGAQGSL